MTLEQTAAPVTFHTDKDLIIELAEDGNAEALFEEACEQFENKKIEQDAQGNVYVMAPAGGVSSKQNSRLTRQLDIWADEDGRGHSFDSCVNFVFPDGSKRSPDGSWASFERVEALTDEEQRKFLKLIPEFVIEIKSPSDRYSKLQAKMEEYRRNGVTLGWLIHPDKRTVAIYRQDGTVEVLEQPETLAADGPVSGFVLDLKPIWRGLKRP
jgi:Uma2 family endonuclease